MFSIFMKIKVLSKMCNAHKLNGMPENEIEELTEKVEQLKLADDLFNNYETVLTELSPKDALILQKLQLIDEYNNKREQLHDSLKEGFINVSRANYANQSAISYGRYHWDSTVKATRKVGIENNHVRIVDAQVLTNEEEEDTNNEQNGDQIRNRKKQTTKEDDSTIKQRNYNPINMFGVLVPYQLRSAQKEFDKSLQHLAQLTEIKLKLDATDHELRRLYKREQRQHKKT